MSTHNLCFRAKQEKIVYPCKLQFYYIKVGVRGSTFQGLVSMMEMRYLDLNSFSVYQE